MQPSCREAGPLNEHNNITAIVMNAIRDVFTARNIVLQQNMYGWYVLMGL